jgi:hypothetical protein
VIFFGRSFVSPNYGTPLLYANSPTLPGFKSATGHDGMGSDVGAVMWWHIPVSRIQSEAIFHDHELPLWNRYDLCGQPLLGQGQSMIGDPLHFMTAVLSGGNSVAWDLKYLAAKWLFAFGMGLTVLALTDRLAVAMLLSASSLYIGFFSFRLNHPAIFSLCYSPWIIYSWILIVGARDAKRSLPWIVSLFTANWAEINSGTVKEAYVLAICLNASGLLALLLSRDDRSLRLRKALLVGWAAFLFILVSAPIWVTFLDTLMGSGTRYNTPDAWQIPAHRMIGFFEDLFYRQATPHEGHVAPSTNFLILIGVLWAVAGSRRLSDNRMFVALGLSAVVPIMLVYGIIPKDAITAVPLLGGIYHIDNTFSCVLIVLAIPLAGFGLKMFLGEMPDRTWLIYFGIVLLLLAALLGLYFGMDRHLAPSRFFIRYIPTLLASVIVLQLASRYLVGKAGTPIGAVLLVILCLLALHWRQGQFLTTTLDDYVFVPQERADFGAASAAIRFTEGNKLVPSRTVGLGFNLFPGFNGTYLIEDIYGIDALKSKEYADLAEGLGLVRDTLFTTIQPNETSRESQAAYDALNVSYFLGSSGVAPAEIAGWEHLRNLDLSVFRSPTVWPRAYFVDHVDFYDGLSELVARIQGAAGRPFAAIQSRDRWSLPELVRRSPDPMGQAIIAARRYTLTNNSTSFDIEAPRPGVVVLSETWLKDDFEATVDGKPVPYFRVNHAFKGVYIDLPGSHRVGFRYWPRYFTLSLWLSVIGMLFTFASVFISLRAVSAKLGA